MSRPSIPPLLAFATQDSSELLSVREALVPAHFSSFMTSTHASETVLQPHSFMSVSVPPMCLSAVHPTPWPWHKQFLCLITLSPSLCCLSSLSQGVSSPCGWLPLGSSLTPVCPVTRALAPSQVLTCWLKIACFYLPTRR